DMLTTLGGLAAASKATAATIRVGTNDSTYVTPLGLTTAANEQTLTDASTVAWDMSLGFNAKVTLAGNRTLGAPTNPVEGQTYRLRIIQDGTG
ncbi:hypothetical protein H6B14_15755, partial [Phocaeicola coprophilus]|nr:hypothetical protein [Phocaeicola coprophilus]